MPGQFTGNRGQAQEWISSWVKEGYTNSQIADALRDFGLSYRQMNMYSDMNRIRLEQFAGEGLKNFSIYDKIPSNLMREWQGDTSYKYRVVVQYDYTPKGGGDATKAATTLYYNTPPSVNDVMEDWGVRVKTIEGGFLGYEQVGQIENIREINYFVNRPKE